MEERLNKLFKKMDKLYNNEINFMYIRKITSQLESEVSINKLFYEDKNLISRQNKVQKLVGAMTTGNNDIYDYVKSEYSSPFGIFSTIFDEDIPDIVMSNTIIKIQSSSVIFKNVYVPESIREAFAFFLAHLVNNIVFIKETKLNMRDAILDADFNEFRFNIVHSSLNSYDGPLFTVRKHIQGIAKKKLQFTPEEYENSLGLTPSEINILRKYSCKSMCVFGEPGSGKTTLLRYLANYKIENKRNLCSIEDTPELGLPISIALITNEHYTIKNLFTAALRQNPSHLIIGETRTDEIVDIMESGLTFNVGTSIHANSFQRALERIYFMSRPRGLNKDDIHDLVSASIDIFIYMDQLKVKGIFLRNDTSIGDIYQKYNIIDLNTPFKDRLERDKKQESKRRNLTLNLEVAK